MNSSIVGDCCSCAPLQLDCWAGGRHGRRSCRGACHGTAREDVATGDRGKPAGDSGEAWRQRLAYFDLVNFAPDVRCPVILGLGLRDYGLSPAPGIIAAYGYLPGERSLVASPWEGHCYPPKFQQLQRTAWQKHIARGP